MSLSEIPDWFNKRICNSFNVGGRSDFGGFALLLHYQGREPDTFQGEREKRKLDEHWNSKYKIFDDNNNAPPSFLCHIQIKRFGLKASLILSAPEIPSSGPNAFWAYIRPTWFYKFCNNYDFVLQEKIGVDFSIESCNLNVDVECWARDIHCNSSDCREGYEGCKDCANREGCVRCLGCANCMNCLNCGGGAYCDGHLGFAEAISDMSANALDSKTVLGLLLRSCLVVGREGV